MYRSGSFGNLEGRELQFDSDFWDKHMHYAPFDKETADTINRHKALITNGTDAFI